MTYTAVDIANSLPEALSEVTEIFGTEHSKLIKTVSDFNIEGTPRLLLESALLGKCGYDVSEKFKIGDIFLKFSERHECASIVKLLKSNEALFSPIYLEFDTFSEIGTPKVPGIFITLEKNPIETACEFLRRMGENERSDSAFTIYNKIFPKFKPVNVGIFTGRTDSPVRFNCTFSPQDFDFEDMLKNEIDRDFIDVSSETMRQIFSCDFFYKFTFDFDMLKDGTIGNRFSYEFKINKKGIASKRKFLDSDEWQEFCKNMIQLGIADNRIHTLENCLRKLPIRNSKRLVCTTSLSHFKITWNNGKLEPLKVYLRAKCGSSLKQ